ncbi:MAG: DNA repair protein RecN [Flavobacteriales bacterium]|nr:DNA repair protein RecN [Flavobacteriales bacterium]
MSIAIFAPMLLELKVDNYVLIKSLRFAPEQGFNIITGETGAGKSILIGALGLVLGDRADTKSILDEEKKCVIEAIFNIKSLKLESFFAENDLDYEPETIIRREILPTGKSRAFVNDTPITLNTLKDLGEKLVDIHSQHQTLRLGSTDFLFHWLDSVTNNLDLAGKFERHYSSLIKKEKRLSELMNQQQSQNAEQDYLQFLFDELQALNLEKIDYPSIENEYELLQNAEEIGEIVGAAVYELKESEHSAIDKLKQLSRQLSKIAGQKGDLATIADRLLGLTSDFEEVVTDLRNIAEQATPDASRLAELDGIFQQIHLLQTKHRVATFEDLLQVKQEIEGKLSATVSTEMLLETLAKEIETDKTDCLKLAKELHSARQLGAKPLEERINKDLKNLGLINSLVKLSLNENQEMNKFGQTDFELLFSSHQSGALQPAHKVASGGELSRLMLILKSYLAQTKKLPTIIFDEIDTGVSGEIANRVAEVMSNLSQKLQVITITHLPQVAAKGSAHFYVYKDVRHSETSTFVKKLNKEERIEELAKMLSGDNPSDAAKANALELINS